jgi:hypothetical protein
MVDLYTGITFKYGGKATNVRQATQVREGVASVAGETEACRLILEVRGTAETMVASPYYLQTSNWQRRNQRHRRRDIVLPDKRWRCGIPQGFTQAIRSGTVKPFEASSRFIANSRSRLLNCSWLTVVVRRCV